MKNKNMMGFTLVELMITVAIIGILSALAIPAYKNYVARSQISEGLNLADGAKSLVAEYYANHGSFADGATLGFNGYTGKYVTQTEIDSNGNIISTFGAQANSVLNGKTVSLNPKVEATGNVSWECSSNLESQYLPNSCTHLEAKTPEELAFQGTFSFGVAGRPVNFTNGVITSQGVSSTPSSFDADGTMHFTIRGGYLVSVSPTGTTTLVSPSTPNLSTITYTPSQTGYNFSAQTNTVTNTDTQEVVVLSKPVLYSTISSYADISDSISALSSAYTQAVSAPNSSNISAYQSALTQLANSIKQVKTDNGGKYPDDWSSDFINQYSKY